MKLIFGLGNPEPEYTNTRHNVGKDILNKYVNSKFPEPKWKHKSEWSAEYMELSNQALAVKPMSYMNDSGSAISKVTNYYKSETKDILVIYDDLDLVVGKYKLVRAKGSKIHNGIVSVNQHLDSEDFWHLRIGVREELIPASVQKSGRDPSKYVLSQFSATDRKKISNMTESYLVTEINNWLSIN